MSLQEWIAAAVVLIVAALALWRWRHRRRRSNCDSCADAGCGIKSLRPVDEDPEVRVVQNPYRKDRG